ncbi:diphthine--ammonia ligase [Sporosarcina thermotolerans]|uniref:Diphthine--ammonia ligase n=1 Tax=Sporosarcina thermotolerans TaxID=633404 RepID=A0AAW9A8L3_9BACL|nr:diphthine--ammonia ligase [Sporosarcina thermotolerans]MDW0117976.1 diphthine--ammonia ligase [Sporosarcina thermotolerans]WHT49054.1 diphthine--ammonia ligase [Sporosarcina thermotolerans]
MNNQPFVASWSGGKDSALAYYRALQLGGIPKRIWTMFEKDKERSKSHALPVEIIQAQADSLGVPLMIRGADWNGYEAEFLDAMKECIEAGIPNGVFGDIDLEDHLTWVQTKCDSVGMRAVHPLWMEPRRKLLEEFVNAGFEAYIVVVNTKMMPSEFIGRKFTNELMDELESLGIDSCGESGEFHTVVIDGPIFKNRVPIVFNDRHEREGYVFLSVGLEVKSSEKAFRTPYL